MDRKPAYLREMAIRYRRLAVAMSDPHTIGALRTMAAGFDQQAEQLETKGSARRNPH